MQADTWGGSLVIDLVKDFADGKPLALKSQTACWRVSVIIPAYRAAETIGRALQSVLNQTYPAAEILIIDDGSPDDIAAAVRAFDGPIRLIRQPNGGAARARNTGIDNRGEI